MAEHIVEHCLPCFSGQSFVLSWKLFNHWLVVYWLGTIPENGERQLNQDREGTCRMVEQQRAKYWFEEAYLGKRAEAGSWDQGS
jgi:hypothetical protein